MLAIVETRAVAERFVAALSDPDQWNALVTEDVGLREYGPTETRILRGRERLKSHFGEELSASPDLRGEVLSRQEIGDRVSVEYRVQRTQDGRYVEDYRAAFLQLRDGQLHTIDLYRAAPTPSAHRSAWIAPATLTDEEIGHLFEEWFNSWDVRKRISPNANFHGSLRGGYGGSGDAHPGSNWVGGFHWPDGVADEKIEAMIERYRAQGIGFTWFVSPFDEPQDLAQRLEAHGLLLAGDQLGMARVGLDPTDIPINPAVEVEVVDGSSEDAIETALQINGRCFNWTREQIDMRRADYYERARDPEERQRRSAYLAWLDGRPVGYGQVIYDCGIAYLGGAATLPEARNQRVYSTLLAWRLRDAHERGYAIAAIHAEPMSRRVVERYRFKPYARFLLYAWMPEPDLDVIRSLVPQD